MRCPVQPQKTVSTKKQARIQQIADHLASVGALPEPDHASKQVGARTSSKGATKKRKEEATAAQAAAAATSAARGPPAALPAISFW